MTGPNVITIDERERVAWLTLNRPPLNILDIATMRELNSQLWELEQRQDLTAVVLSATGRVFSAGVDIPQHRRDTIEEMLTVVFDLYRALYALPMPTVCAVQGDALGGGMELAITCDAVLSTDDARFGVPEITLGVFPPVAVAHLPHVIGMNCAAELILTGRMIRAQEAQTIGLVNQVYAAAEFDRQVENYLTQYRRLSAYSLRQTKMAMRRVAASDFESALSQAIALYREQLIEGRDPHEGIEAFIEKRPPQWSDT